MTTLLLLSILAALASAQLGLPGGKVTVTVEPTAEPVVFAVQAINNQFKTNGDATPRELAEIISAQSQVVAGQLLYLNLRLTGAQSNNQSVNEKTVKHLGYSKEKGNTKRE
ncbi:hypothetical protein C0Q70_13909 [Pomacea canaliculata]|uniref:Cystatin domain-containing protein n=1 Tax=Pomacea canaliculata TaxID=400727 RepID=A0A2T7NYJ5_POMCA|nr:hypothetical protein C0Q70_13909 [Pomacea canaliculata]